MKYHILTSRNIIIHNIILLLLFNFLNGIKYKRFETQDKLKSENTIADTRKLYFWTMHQLQRCYLWSRTLAPQERLDYLITLRRKVIKKLKKKKLLNIRLFM